MLDRMKFLQIEKLCFQQTKEVLGTGVVKTIPLSGHTLMDEDFRAKLLAAKSKEAFLQVIDEMEREKYPDEPQEAPKAAPEADGRIKVLAVTACPTGIAHTYMAAEALEKAGKKLGISIKVETNGSGGAKNILTKEEIEQCDGIIVAADKNVEMARFNGKKVWKTKVSDGIKIPEELIQKMESGDVPVYHHAGGAGESQDSGDNESFGRKMYKHLMNGVSNMLPFTIAGGIFVFAVVGNWPFYLLSLAIGSLVGMLMLAVLKKKKVPATAE